MTQVKLQRKQRSCEERTICRKLKTKDRNNHVTWDNTWPCSLYSNLSSKRTLGWFGFAAFIHIHWNNKMETPANSSLFVMVVQTDGACAGIWRSPGALVWQRDQTDICQWKFANPGGISTWQRSRMQAACLPRPRPSNKGKVRAGSCCACAVWSLTTWQTCRQLDSLPCSRSWARARFADIIEQAETVRKPSRNEHIHLISRRGTEVWRHWVSLSRPRQGREGHRQTGRSCLGIGNIENSWGTFAIRKCCDLQAWLT